MNHSTNIVNTFLAFALALASATKGQVFKVTYDSATGGELSRELQDNECYHFTYLGPWNEATNNTSQYINCDFITEKLKMPCFEPLVFTEGQYRMNGPNLSQVVSKCAAGETLSGETCVPKCSRTDERVCVKVTYTQKDQYDTILYQSFFCGKGVDTTNGGRLIEKGCFRATDNKEEEFRTEACFCEGNFCNASVTLALANTLSGFLLLLAPLTYYFHWTFNRSDLN